MITDGNDTRDSEEKNVNSLSTDEYYTKDDVDARLEFKADATKVGYEMVTVAIPGHSSWELRYQRLGMGVVTVTLKSSDFPASQGSGAYITYATGVYERFRPPYNLYFMGTDAGDHDRCIGLMKNGEIRVYNSTSVGVYGSTTFFSGQV